MYPTCDIELYAVVTGGRIFEINPAAVKSFIGCCGAVNDQVARSGNKTLL